MAILDQHGTPLFFKKCFEVCNLLMNKGNSGVVFFLQGIQDVAVKNKEG